MQEPGKEYKPPEPPELSGGQDDLRQLQEWAKLLGDSGLSLLKLVKAELTLTLVEMPRLIVLSIALVPFALLAWIGFSVLAGWLAWAWSEQIGLGIFAFFVLQVIPCVVLMLQIAKIEKALFFPATKRQLKKLAEFMKEP